MKKIVFIDLDGTLLKNVNSKSISKKNIKYIKELQQNNIFVVICTGRSRKEAVEAQNLIRYNSFGDYIIYSGGTVLEDVKNNKIIEQKSLSKDEIKVAVEIAKKEKFALKIDGIDSFFVETKKGYKFISKVLNLQLKSMDKLIIASKTNKIGMLSKRSQSKNEEFKNLFIKKYKQFDVHLSGKNHYFEITPKGINKGSMVIKACKILKINMENTACIGDSMNDYEMFKVVAHPICMKNGNKKLKEISNYITTSNTRNGVANSEKYLKWLKK